jgi:hypothetical protein
MIDVCSGNGTGGLMVLRLDGSREAPRPFGYRAKPVGLAVLRGSGALVHSVEAGWIGLAHRTGVKTAGRIVRFESVSWEHKPNDSSTRSGIDTSWKAQTPDRP